jgi:energy-coupling factor transport system substrate-specific component
MKEVVTMWRHTKMVALTGLTAAVYAAILIPFKGIPIIPGITEIRPASVVPVAFGLLFGPAGAWGSAIGNAIGDLFGGTITPGSLFGFVGNFFFALTAYKAWGNMGPFSGGSEVRVDGFRRVLEVVLIAILSAAVCAAVIAWGLEFLSLLPFAGVGPIIFLNNALAGVLLGPILLRLLQPRVASWQLLWTDILDAGETSARLSPRLGAFLMWLGGIGGLAAGLAGLGVAGVKGVSIVPALLLVYLVGCFLA